VDEVKITKSSLFHTSKIETSSQTLSGLAEQCPALPEKALKTHRKSQPDNVWSDWTMSEPYRILNLGPIAIFLRELYIYLHTSNSTPLLAFEFSC
jgi:hypothetical protein